MMTIEMRIGDLEIGKDRAGILKDIIFELFQTEPRAIEAVLSGGGQLLDRAETKINSILKDMNKLKANTLQKLCDLQELIIQKQKER